VIGLTGAPAAGKSSVAHVLADLRCAVIDVDALGHQALDDESVRECVVALFGPGVCAADGRLDRAALARRVFGSPRDLERLEGFVHPAVRRLLATRLAAARAGLPRAVVLDCALLFESGLEALCDTTVCVHSAPELRERRAAERGWSAGETARREAHQLPADAKRARADHVLCNDDDRETLARHTRTLLDRIAPKETVRPGGGTRGTLR
jgi:dephospho-CoA kinase